MTRFSPEGGAAYTQQMDSRALPCPDCAADYDSGDNYCRKCGMYLAALGGGALATMNGSTRALETVRPGLPAPMRRAATAVALGAALQVGVGLAAKYFAAQGASKAAATALATQPKRGKEQRPPRYEEDDDPLANVAAVSETVVVRRVWIRRP